MINAWGGKGEKGVDGASNTNQLTDLKIFFSKEVYSTDGVYLK